MPFPTSVGRAPAHIDPAGPADSIASSREIAVRRVFRGLCAAVAGPALMGVASIFGVASGLPFAVGMAGFVLGGFGLVEIGRASRHFLRYGSRTSQIGFVATAGLGASVVCAGLSNWVGVTTGGAVWDGIIHWSMNGVYGFGTIVLVLALRALLLLAFEAATREHEARG